MRAANTKIQRRRQILAGFVRGGRAIVVALVVCLPGISHAQPPPASGLLAKDLQNDLAALASLARATTAVEAASAVPRVRQLLERIRATDLLIQEQRLSIEQRLQRTKASGRLLQRQQDHARLFRERMDRLYQAGEPLTSDTPPSDAQTRAALAAILETLRDAIDTESRTPIGAILPYRSLAWPQIAPQPAAALTPAYLTTPVPAPQAADLAETPETLFTGAIRNQAAALSQDAIAIFEFVQNSVRSEFYYGAMKDAAETLRQASGNDTDQASLLIALLRASQVPARYVRGVIRLTGAQAVAWTGAGSTRRAAEVFTRAGIPFRPILQGGSIGAFEIEHTWVEAFVPYGNYRGVRLGTIGRAWIPLDPSFKAVDTTAGADVLAAMGFNAATIVASFLSPPQPLAPMEFYREAITGFLTQTGSPLTFDEVLATRTTRASHTGLLPSTLPYSVVSIHGESPALADALRHRVRFVADGEGGVSFDVTISAAELAGRRLTLSYVPATVEDQAVAHSFLGLDNTPAYLVKLRPVLKVGGVVRAAGATPVQMGGFHAFTVEIHTPRGMVPVVNSMLAGGYYALGLAAQPAAYEIPLARPPDDTEHPAADRLYSIAIDYLRRWNDAEQTLERLLRVVNVRPALSHVIVGTVHARTVVFGQPQAIEWRGVFVDADLRVAEPVPTGADDTRAGDFMRLSGLAGSVLEADVLRSNLNVDAVSAASVIQLAHEGAIVVEDVTAGNLAEVLARLQTADIVKTEIADAVNQGWRVTIPQRDLSQGIWTGIGYVMVDPATGAGGYFLSGGLAGGISVLPPAEWPDEPIVEELSGPNAEPANDDPTAVRFLTKVASADRQTGIVDRPLERSLKVWARDQEGRPVKNATVTFVTQAGGGRFEDGDTYTATTNHLGIAEATFRLGRSTSQQPYYVRANPGDAHVTQVGQNVVTAFVTSNTGPVFLAAPFQQFAYPGPPASIVKVLGDHSAPPGTLGTLEPGLFGGSVVARVEDEFNNPISNVAVRFSVLPAEPITASTVFPPPGAINLRIYPHEPACPVLTPVLGDCNAIEGFLDAASSSDGAAVNTILGNTVGTTFRVQASIPAQAQVPPQTFQLLSRTARGFGNGLYYAPELLIMLPTLVSASGIPINAAPAGTQLSKPLEAMLMLREDEYVFESTGQACPDPDDVCYRVRSLETSRIRPIDVNGNGEVSFAGVGNAVVSRLRSLETAAVSFAAAPGVEATTTPPVNTSSGRYASQVTVGLAPALNTINVTASATIWVPCFDLHAGTVSPMLLQLAAGQNAWADSMFFPAPQAGVGSCVTTGAVAATGVARTVTHSVYGVRGTVSDAIAPVSTEGLTLETLPIEYQIQPPQYVASVADIDLFEIDAGVETWKGALTGSASSDTGSADLLQGTVFDLTKTYQTQLVMNRGTEVEIRSPRAPLTLLSAVDLTLAATDRTVVKTYLDRTNQTSCAAPAQLSFSLSDEASLTIRVDGSVLTTSGESGPMVWNGVTLSAGDHAVPVTANAVPLPGIHTFTIEATFARPDGSQVLRSAGGFIQHDVIINASLPVGHTLVKGVDLLDGHLSLVREDVSIPGHGPTLQFTRSYSSSGHRASGVIGAGWVHNYDARILRDTCGTVTLVGGEGSGVKFSQPAPGVDGAGNPIETYTPQAGYHGRLVLNVATGSYDYFTKQGVRYHYEKDFTPGEAFDNRLSFIEDSNGNRLTLRYEAGAPFNLQSVTDASGRSLTFTYQPFGLVPENRLTRIEGPLDLVVTYAYDEFGNLKTAARDVKAERYEYTIANPQDRHNLIRVVGPNNGATGPNADVTQVSYFGEQDDIAGWVANPQLFAEKFEMVRTITDGFNTPEAATHQFSYDYSAPGTGFVTTVIDPRQVATRHTIHAGFGAVLEKRVQTPDGDNVTITRWAFQDGINDVFITRTIDPNGRIINYFYDANGNPQAESVGVTTVPYEAVIDSAGTAVDTVGRQSTYEPVFGRVTQEIDAAGRITLHALDPANGNTLSTTLNALDGSPPIVTRYSYGTVGSLRGLVLTITDPNGRITTHTYDAYGNATEVVDSIGRTTNVFDARSRLRESHDTFGHRTTYEYDALDRLISETRSTWVQPADLSMASVADRRTTTTYFPGGQPRTVTSGTGHVTTLAYDALNRQAQQLDTVTDANGAPTTLAVETTWDGNSNKILERDRRGLSHGHVYDALNRVVESAVEGQVIARYTYDAAGNRRSEVDMHGHTTRFIHDGLYRVVRTGLPLAPYATSSRYDLVGNVLATTDANGHTTSMTYDGLNRLTSTTDALGSVKRIQYDAAGNRVVEEDERVGLITRYDDFDGRNRPAAMRQQFTDPLTGQLTTYTTRFTYLDAENTKLTTSPKGVVTRERFNGHDALIERTDDVGGLNLVTTFRYDGNGNLTGEKDAEGAGIDKQFTFDGLNRRLSAVVQLDGSERWFYDGNGNIIRSFDRRGVERTFDHDHLDRNIRQGLVESISNGGATLTLTTVVHDDAANAVITTDANGHPTRQELDALHRASRVVDPLGAETRTEWDGVNQTAEIDKRGIRTEVTYDAINRPIEQRILDGANVFVQHTGYNDALSRTVATDLHLTTELNFGQTVTQHDALQRLRRTSRIHPDLATRYGVAELVLDERTYDEHDNVVRLVDANGNVTLTEYDGADRPVRVTEGAESAVAAQTAYVYDRADNLLEVKDGRPHGNRFDVKHFYDARYRKVMSQTGAGEVTIYTYDQNDNLASFTEPKGGAHATLYGYDELNQVLWVDETRGGAGGVTHYRYDANRNQVAQQDAAGNLTTFRYDARNRQTDMFQHLAPGALDRDRPRDAGAGGLEATAQHWVFGFDVNGNQILTIDAAGQRVDKDYDGMDRLIRRTYSAHQPDATGNPVFPRPTRIDYGYDSNGNQVRVDETKDFSAGQTVVETTTMQYDALNRLTSRANYDGKTVRFEYDRSGNRTAVIDADGNRTGYAFDARNRLTTAVEAGLQTAYAYWPDGLQRTVTYPNGIITEFTYDTADRLLQIVNHSGDPAAPVSRYDYSYDANGNRRTQIERHARLNGGAAQETAYSFDAANRLIGVDFPGQAGMTYTYAANGNRLTESGVTPANHAAVARQYAYNRLNQLTTIADNANPAGSVVLRYDRNGNTSEHRIGILDPGTGDVPAPTAVKRFAWNIRDYLAKADGVTGPVTFDYDHEGRRVKTIAPVFQTRYLYDLNNVLQEYDGSGLATTLKYSYGPTGLLSLNTGGANGRSYYLRDAVGSTTELIDVSGDTRASYSYDPWGKVLASFDTTPNRHRFTGQISDTETGLQYFGARYYDDTIGRFLSQDEYLGDANDPASQHRYQYALANPFRFIDPSGFQNVEAGSGFGPGNPCQGVPVTEACNPATKEVDDMLEQINAGYEARAKLDGQQLAEQVEHLYETRKSVYKNLNTYQRARQLAETMQREELLARLEKVEGGGISELATLLGEEVAGADPDSLAGAGLGALLHSVGKVASFFEPSGTINVTWKLNQGQDVTLYDAAGVGLDAALLLAPAAASKLNGARQVAFASWKNTAGKALNRRVKAVLEEIVPLNPLDSKSQRFYQEAADRLGVDVAFRAVDPVTKGVTTALGWLPNIRPKPAGNIGKSIFGYINTAKGRFRADADVLFVKDRLTGKIWDNAKVMRELVSPTNRAIRAAGGKTLVAHGSHFSAYKAAGGPLKTLDKLAKIGDPGGAVVIGRNSGRYISQTTARAIGMGSGRWHLAWDRKFPYPKFSAGGQPPAPFMGPYPAGRAVSEHAQPK